MMRAAVFAPARLDDDAGGKAAALTVNEKALQPNRIDCLVDELVT